MPIPLTDSTVSLKALQDWWREKTILAALQSFHAQLGDIFQINLPGFRPIMLVGAEANRFMLVTHKDEFLWRAEHDPVTDLLRQGVLVVDGEAHDHLRRAMNPALHRTMLTAYSTAMVQRTDQVIGVWQGEQDMLVEMRRVALLILVDTLFKVDYTPEMQRLWQSVIKCIQYISPGVWMLWRGTPRPGYQRYLQQMDNYLYRIIALRRLAPTQGDDLLSALINIPDMSDDLIRDQLLTMLIAGHDTSTALLTWALYFMGMYPAVQAEARAEVDTVLGTRPPTIDDLKDLRYLGNVIDETLRLYPPIHLGSRTAARDLEFKGYTLPAGQRVLYSIYLMHRHLDHWSAPNQFMPERFDTHKPEPYTYLPFGGGSRNCIGSAFAGVEAKIVLARILQQYTLDLLPGRVHAHMGATLEPRPGVRMQVTRRY